MAQRDFSQEPRGGAWRKPDVKDHVMFSTGKWKGKEVTLRPGVSVINIFKNENDHPRSPDLDIVIHEEGLEPRESRGGDDLDDIL